MSTFAVSDSLEYQTHRASTIEAGSLLSELAGRTSSSQTTKQTTQSEWHLSTLVPPHDVSLLAFCADILHLTEDIQEDDEPLSKNALWAAIKTVGDAVAQLPNQWRRPRVTTDGGGGIRLTWRRGEKEIRAVFPADDSRPKYLFVEHGEVHKLTPNFNGMTLCNEFEWLHSANDCE